jgi:plasmid stabilization system protein ParE
VKAFILSPEAEEDVWHIWQYLVQEAELAVADRVEATLFAKMELLASMPGIGHWRRDLTGEPVKFFAVYSYLINQVDKRNKLSFQIVMISRLGDSKKASDKYLNDIR